MNAESIPQLNLDEAWQMLRDDPDAVLIDVRTMAEWNFVGVPDLSSLPNQLRTVEWTTFPTGAANPNFVDQATEGLDAAQPILLLCRSRRPVPGRSPGAAGQRLRQRPQHRPGLRRPARRRQAPPRWMEGPPAMDPGLTPEAWSEATVLVRGGLDRSGFDETAEALYLTSGYVYSSAAEAEKAFAGDHDRYIYSRYGNPTVTTFEERLRLLEGAEACRATASGMAAVFAALACYVRAGDRVVGSRALFGSCFVILNEILPRLGVETELIDGTSADEWERALSAPTRMVFLETPSNPSLELIDLAAVAERAHAAGALVVVDNVFATPILQKPLDHGADIVVYSATKHIDGQGRTLGGAVLASGEFVTEHLVPFTRHTGPSLSPFNAWVLLKGMETLRLRGRGPERRRPRTGPAAQRRRGGRSVSAAGDPSPGRVGTATDGVRRHHPDRRCRHQGSGLRLRGPTGAVRHLEQHRRHQDPRHPPGHHHPPAAGSGGPGPRSASVMAWSGSPWGSKTSTIFTGTSPGRWPPLTADGDVVARYLRRLGLEVAPPPTVDGVEQLMRAHLTAVPFENLDVFLQRGWPRTGHGASPRSSTGVGVGGASS